MYVMIAHSYTANNELVRGYSLKTHERSLQRKWNKKGNHYHSV